MAFNAPAAACSDEVRSFAIGATAVATKPTKVAVT
jgi:hypothetical protein